MQYDFLEFLTPLIDLELKIQFMKYFVHFLVAFKVGVSPKILIYLAYQMCSCYWSSFILQSKLNQWVFTILLFFLVWKHYYWGLIELEKLHYKLTLQPYILIT